MIAIEVDALAAIARLAALGERLRSGMQSAIDTGAQQLLACVQAKLSGEVLNPRTGALRAGICSATDENESGFAARVFSDGSLPYARIQEYGGRVAIPEIFPVKARALAFVRGGRMVFAAHTAPHVVNIPERSYLRSSLAEFAPALLDTMRKVAAETLQ